MSRKAWIISALCFVAGSLLFITFGLPPILKNVASKKISEKLGRPTRIAEIKINPFTLRVVIRGFSLGEPDGKGEFISVDELITDLQISSLFRKALVIKELTITRPSIKIELFQNHTYNFSDLLAKKSEKPPETAPPESSPFRFFLGNVRITGGQVDFANRSTATNHTISNIEFFIPVVSNLPIFIEEFAQPRLTFSFDKSPVDIKGRTKPFKDSLETEFDIVLNNLNLLHYLPYNPSPLNFDVKSATAALNLKLSYVQHHKKEPTVLLSGRVTLSDLALAEKNGADLLGFKDLNIELAGCDLMARNFKLTSLVLNAPYANIRKLKSGKLNLDVLTPSADSTKQPREAKQEKTATVSLSIDNIELNMGKVDFKDDSMHKPFATTLGNFEVQGQGFDLTSKSIKNAQMKITTVDAETAEASIQGVYSPLNLSGDFSLSKFNLPKYSPYYRDKIRFNLAKGLLGFSGRFTINGLDKIVLTGGTLTLDDLVLKLPDDKTSFFSLAALKLTDGSADSEARKISVAISLQKPEIHVKRDAAGALSISNLIASESAQPVGDQPSADPQKPWLWTLAGLQVERGNLVFDDFKPSQPAIIKLSKISVNGSGITNEPGKKGKTKISFNTTKQGSASLDGVLVIEPLSGEFNLGLKGVDLPAFGPYVSDKVKIDLLDGTLFTDCKVVFQKNPDGKTPGGFRGDVDVMNVRIIAKQSAEDLLKWGSLSLKGLNVRTEPNQVTLDSVSLTDPYFRVDVAPDSSVNLTKLTVDNQAEPPTAEKPQQQQESTPVELKSITLAGAVIDFSDRHIQPNYRMKFINLAGRVSRMSSEESGGGEVNLLGNLDGYAPLEITGLLNPFAKNLLVDLKIDFRNMDLNPLTPYSARYLGYKIEKGKLDLALTYKILNRKLDSQNKIVFDQFTLGEEVESPDAVKLPVRFALALLTDRNGMIDLDVPITGTLDDPDFSYGKILWKVLVNIITKAATAPFALLGSLFGGGDELSFVPFAPAVDNLDQGATGRLDKLAKALTERPALRLEIAGHADPDLDAPGLRDLALERKLKTQKLKEAIKLGQQAAGLEAITVTAEERPKFIEMVFKDEKIPRPAKEARPLTAEEMEKLIITRITIGSDDLKLLTRKRVATVRDYLIDQGKLDPKRVFLAETPTENSAKKENVPAGRVEFTLK